MAARSHSRLSDRRPHLIHGIYQFAALFVLVLALYGATAADHYGAGVHHEPRPAQPYTYRLIAP